MKLEPKAKPVRIRIKSGGEEHFNLESLKRNFSVQDLWEAVTGGSLSRWLRQQNETELAKKVDEFCHIKKLSNDNYIKFSALFFEKESINDANSLVTFYLEKKLIKNFQYAFPYLLESLDYQNGKIWFNKYRERKNIEDWIAFFNRKLPDLELKEQVDCYCFLYELYKNNNDTVRMKGWVPLFQNSVEALSIQDGLIIDSFLEKDDFFLLKTLFEDSKIKKQKEVQTWISSFENCKKQLPDSEKAECLYILSKLYKESKEKKKANECLMESNQLGNKKARLELMKLQSNNSRYPELTEILKSYEDEITLEHLPKIYKSIMLCDEYDYSEIYSVFQHCIGLFMEVNGNNPLYSKIDSVIDERGRLSRQYPKFQPLIYIVTGLAWEQKKGSKELFVRTGKTAFSSNYQKIIDAKKYNNAPTVTGEKGLECDLLNDSPIEQMFFFMETYGEQYSFDYLRNVVR